MNGLLPPPLLPAPPPQTAILQQHQHANSGYNSSQEMLNSSFGEKAWLNASANDKNWLNNSFNLNSSLNLPPELRYKSLSEMVGKITDEDMLAASASGNSNALHFAAFKNISNQMQQQHQQNQVAPINNYANSVNANNSAALKVYLQDSNPGYEPVYMQMFESQQQYQQQAAQVVPGAASRVDFESYGNHNNSSNSNNNNYKMQQQLPFNNNNQQQQRGFNVNNKQPNFQQNNSNHNSINKTAFLSDQMLVAAAAANIDQTSTNNASLDHLGVVNENMPLAFPSTYGHHLAKLTSDQQSYLLEQQRLLVLTMEQIAVKQQQQASPVYMKNSPSVADSTAVTLQRMSSSSSSSSSTTTNHATSPLVSANNSTGLLKTPQQQQLKNQHSPNFNLPLTIPASNQSNEKYDLTSPLLPSDSRMSVSEIERFVQNGFGGGNFTGQHNQNHQNFLHQQQQQFYPQHMMQSPSVGYNQQQLNGFFLQQQQQQNIAGYQNELMKSLMNVENGYPSPASPFDSIMMNGGLLDPVSGKLLNMNIASDKLKYLLMNQNRMHQQQQGQLQHHQQQQQQYRQHRRTGPANELHIRLEEALYQFKCLENERKKFEADLSHLSIVRKTSTVSSPNGTVPSNQFLNSNNGSATVIGKVILAIPPMPRLATNPSRVDRLIFDYTREYARIVSLVLKIDNLRNTIFFEGIQLALHKWLHQGINNVQARRKDELINNANKQRLGHQAVPPGSTGRISDEKDVITLANAINELSGLTKKARTVLWCAVQISNVNYKQSVGLLEPKSLPAGMLTVGSASDSLFDTVDKTRQFVQGTFEIKTDLLDEINASNLFS